ncbi:MAG: type II-A CRISPR-associated protein Csn2 [Enterococcus sp.]
MKINFPLFDEGVEIDKFTILVIEDVQVFSELSTLFYQYEEINNLKIYDRTCKSLKSQELMVITDILGFDLNSASTLKSIHCDLFEQLNEQPEVKSEIECLLINASSIVGHETLEHELDLSWEDIDINGLFKLMKIRVEDKSATIFEKILEIIQVFGYLSTKKLLVFINCLAYLTEGEIIEVAHYIDLSNVDTLFLEPRKIKGQSQFILDEDYFFYTEKLN